MEQRAVIDFDADSVISRHYDELVCGLVRYTKIMTLFKQSEDLTNDDEFRYSFDKYYKVLIKKGKNKDYFYTVFNNLKNNNEQLDFYSVLCDIKKNCGYVEIAFVSKMLATIDDSLPIIDSHVLSNTKLKIKGSNEEKIKNDVNVYNELRRAINAYIQDEQGVNNLKIFNERILNYVYKITSNSHKISNVKQIDFLLWANW